MTTGQRIEVSHEVRMWVTGVVVPTIVTVGTTAVVFRKQIAEAIDDYKERRRIKKMMRNSN